MAARKAREDAANMSMYVPGMPSARQNLPHHFDALSPVGRMNPARPLIHELSFDSYDSRPSSRGSLNLDRSSDRANNDSRRSRGDHDNHSSRDRNNVEKGLRSQSEWEEHPYRKKTRYSR